MRDSYLPFHSPEIGDEEVAEVSAVLRSNWITTGPRVRQFEEEFVGYIGCTYAVALNSCTAGLHLALEAIGVNDGDEVIVPTLTFAASAEVVLYFRACPVLVDCVPDTFNLDPRDVERAITPKTKAIIPVHYAGQACDMDRILELARHKHLKVIEDAAHALPARYNGRMVGTLGDITAFSFYATKTITTGEGGMLTTENRDYADRVRIMSLHGITTDAWKRYTAEGSWYYEILAPGYKYNMMDIQAALGSVQLRKCERLWQRRREIAEAYNAGFAECGGVDLPTSRPNLQHAWHLYVIRLNLEQLTIDRGRFIQELKARNVGTSVHFIPLHLHPYYREALGYKRGDLPIAEEFYQRCISLPIYPKMTEKDVTHVIEAVWDVSKRFRR